MTTEGEIGADTILKIAHDVARRFKRRCWWADMDDLTGEASRIVLEASRSWDPQVGVPFWGYAHTAAVRGLGAYLWQQSAPVSEKAHRRKDLAGVYKTDVNKIDEEKFADVPDAGELLDETRWRDRVRHQIERLAAVTPNGHLAVQVLVHEIQPADLEAPRSEIYRAVHLVRRKIKEDYDLYYLWDELR